MHTIQAIYIVTSNALKRSHEMHMIHGLSECYICSTNQTDIDGCGFMCVVLILRCEMDVQRLLHKQSPLFAGSIYHSDFFPLGGGDSTDAL